MLLVLGRSDLGLKLEIIKKITITLAIIIGIQFGIYGLVIGEVIAAYINLFINAYYSKIFLKYSLYQQVKDVSATFFFSIITGLLILCLLNFTPITGIFLVILASGGGLVVYFGLHLFAKTEEMQVLLQVILPKTIHLLRH